MPEFLDLHSKTTKALRAVTDPVMRRHGLHLGQNYVLAELWKEDGQTPGEIAGMLRVTTPTITKMATRMAAAGLLVRKPDGHDNRLVRLWLTDAGRALRGPIEADLRGLEAEITAGLSKAERQQLMSALTKIQQSAGVCAEAPQSQDAADAVGERGDYVRSSAAARSKGRRRQTRS